MGVELLLGICLGFVVLGPRRMHSMLGDFGRMKARFDKASQEIKSQLRAEFEKPARKDVKPLTLTDGNAGEERGGF